jgi:hypothetical protein
MQLDGLIDAKISREEDLERRMQSMELQLRKVQGSTANDSDDTATIRGEPPILDTEQLDSEQSMPLKFVFEPREFQSTLHESRVYRRNELGSERFSFSTSIARESAWSALSEFSLSDISVLSVVALPVYVSELPTTRRFFKGTELQAVENSMCFEETAGSPKKPGNVSPGPLLIDPGVRPRSRCSRQNYRKIAVIEYEDTVTPDWHFAWWSTAGTTVRVGIPTMVWQITDGPRRGKVALSDDG